MAGTEAAPPAPGKPRTYTFHPISACNMCGADAADATVLGLRLNGSQGRRPRGRRGVAVSVCRCGCCGLIFSDPQPVPQSMDDHYGVPPDAYWKVVDYEPAPGYFQRQVDTAKRLLQFRPGMKAIDIGLGLGKGAKVMRREGFDVYGCEPSRQFFDKCVGQLGNEDGRFQCASIEGADFEAGSFEFVTFGAVLEHIYDPSAALARAMSWLKPGGIIHAEIPSSRHLMSRIINSIYFMSFTNYVTNISPMHVPYHLHEFTLESFRLNGRRTGYEIADHWIDVASIYHVPRIFHPPLRTIMERTGTGMQLTVFLRKPASGP